MMGSIYRFARKVIVWLGPAERKSDYTVLEMLANPGTGHSQGSYFQQELLDDVRFRAVVGSMLERRYWTRLWIIQEFVLAPLVEIWVGNMTLNQPAAKRLQRILSDDSVLSQTAACQLLEQRFRCNSMSKQTLLDVLVYSQSANCSVTQDKVYALLSLAD